MSNLTMSASAREQVRSNLLNMAPNKLTKIELNEWLAEQMVVEDYRYQARQKMIAALPRVVALAQTRCSGGYVAATLLLNIYNHHDWHFDLVSMRNLDFDNWRACMDVLEYQILSSPDKDVHHYIENGNKLLHHLWERFESTTNYIGKK